MRTPIHNQSNKCWLLNRWFWVETCCNGPEPNQEYGPIANTSHCAYNVDYYISDMADGLTTWAIMEGSSSRTRLPSPIGINLGDESTITSTFHGLTHITQDLQLDTQQFLEMWNASCLLSNHSTLSPPKPAKMPLLSLQRLYYRILLRPSNQKPQLPPVWRERNNRRQLRRVPTWLQHLQSLQDYSTKD